MSKSLTRPRPSEAVDASVPATIKKPEIYTVGRSGFRVGVSRIGHLFFQEPFQAGRAFVPQVREFDADAGCGSRPGTFQKVNNLSSQLDRFVA